MSLADIIANWDNSFSSLLKSRAERPYLDDFARSNRDMNLYSAENARNMAGLSGVKLQFEPQMSQAELELKRLAPSMTNAQIANIMAQTRHQGFLTDNPLLDKTGTAGQLGSLMYLNSHPELSNVLSEDNNQRSNLPGDVRKLENISPWRREDLQIGQEGIGRLKDSFGPNIHNFQNTSGDSNTRKNDIASLLKESIISDLTRKNAYADLANKKSENYGYGMLTADQKRRWVAQAQGMGVSENDARKFFNKGGSIQELAEAKGFDQNNLPEAIYSPTNTDITRAHFRQQAVSEIDAMQQILTEAVAPYSQRIMGYSPKQISEAIKGENPDAQARFLAAKALQPEMASLRTKAMGGQVGIEAIREIQNASMGNINSFQSLVSPEVYSKAQQYMQDWISLGSKTANAIAFNPEIGQNKEIGSTNNKKEDPLGIR